MRRYLAIIAIPLLAALALAGCGGSSSSSSSSGNANASVTVTGSFGKSPNVTIPKANASNKFDARTLVTGTGPTVSSSDTLVGNFAFYLWSGTSSKLVGSSFGNAPQVMTPLPFAGLKQALLGKTVGSRVLAVIPPSLAYGSQGDPQAGISGTDTLVFVVDLLKTFPGNAKAAGAQVSTGGGNLPTVTGAPGSAPTVKIPANQPTASMVKKVLIKGTGPALQAGQYVLVQYTGVIWRTGQVFDSSWQRQSPFGFILGQPGGVIPGWDLGLEGQNVGSRVLLVIPPAQGYGKQGAPSAGIKPTDTLVFAVDILGAFTQSS